MPKLITNILVNGAYCLVLVFFGIVIWGFFVHGPQRIDANMWLVVFTGLLLLVGVEAAKASKRSAEIAASGIRAWLVPIKANIAWEREGKKEFQTFEPEHPIHIDITYRNVGKQPAIWFVADFDIRSFECPASGDWRDTFPKMINFCDRVSAKEGAVVYPSDGRDFTYEISSQPNNRVSRLTERIVEGKDVLYVVGCFAYKSFGRERKSQFCFMLNPVGPDPRHWQFRNAIRGNTTYGDDQ